MSTYNIGPVSGQGNVFGDNNQVTNQIAVPAATRDVLENLRAALRDNADDLTDPDGMRRATDDLEEELTADAPDRGRISRLLHGLLLGAGTVTAVTTALEGLENTVLS
ncbi:MULTISPECIES: hypothetical protein [Protofrankia]|uniref:Uncharacterized protein n=1 Tax=Protofrankia coriariae TaxID=1562887 RepID=A0ABR5EYR0_9ACTN|nr:MULTISPECIES: hypothetical protein [Protofrankia]KLL09591.1 hypothetical protein FrCorBMG51_23830 [Protofrankia coriariae]ONH31011.1 hypothetical protein BL254_23640 [Protofrankia sp. BMG5.30]